MILQEDENMADADAHVDADTDVYEIPTESDEGDAHMAMLEEQ